MTEAEVHLAKLKKEWKRAEAKRARLETNIQQLWEAYKDCGKDHTYYCDPACRRKGR